MVSAARGNVAPLVGFIGWTVGMNAADIVAVLSLPAAPRRYYI
jgi:hypothetical protein